MDGEGVEQESTCTTHEEDSMSDMGNDKNASDVADTPTPDADEAVDEQTGSDLEGNANDDVVETEDAG